MGGGGGGSVCVCVCVCVHMCVYVHVCVFHQQMCTFCGVWQRMVWGRPVFATVPCYLVYAFSFALSFQSCLCSPLYNHPGRWSTKDPSYLQLAYVHPYITILVDGAQKTQVTYNLLMFTLI